MSEVLCCNEELKKADSFVADRSIVKASLKASDVKFLRETKDEVLFRNKVKTVFNLTNFAQMHRSAGAGKEALDILVDFMQNSVIFTIESEFSLEKSIVFISIYFQMLQEAISLPFYSPEILYTKYKELLLSHSIERPPFSTHIFELLEVKQIDDFFINTFFRNLKLLMNLFTKKPVLSFAAKKPVSAKQYALPPLVEMTKFVEMKEGEEVQVPIEEPKSAKGKKESARSAQTARALQEKQMREQQALLKEQQLLLQQQQQQQMEEDQKENMEESCSSDAEDKGPEIPIDIIVSNLSTMHSAFVASFDQTEHKLIAKIKELEIKMKEKPPSPVKKTGRK